jgi:hypothetical protein
MFKLFVVKRTDTLFYTLAQWIQLSEGVLTYPFVFSKFPSTSVRTSVSIKTCVKSHQQVQINLHVQ